MSTLFAEIALALSLAQGSPPACGPMARLRFFEDWPDNFSVENLSLPGWDIAEVRILLESSEGQLVFDTEPGGGGSGSPRPFLALGGPAKLAAIPAVPDGAAELTLEFAEFSPGASFGFTIDMDDQLNGRSPTNIAGSEITGARAVVTFVNNGMAETYDAAFDLRSEAVPRAFCVS